ncbi:cytochrome b/b6 domain-containing protein [Parasulfitobacter algicola]|uniref:Cytochrome b/b6 domain-containing protein n=1 Tax=Parasulfitobacter algicola TaxID=2614809 RepID=A0ABX2IUI4_9RHOB|nr:cytochrome b/b6 domain-containing protein [Sulfitobacter algicola]NSX54502.1 cytochrome b/b6 domain-containing protein [Sulfitobacter algicola]
MALSNTTTSYGTLAKSFHWAIVLLILTVIPLGVIGHNIAHQIEDPSIATTQDQVELAAFLFSMHKTIGVTIFFLALGRILWTITQPKPAPLASHKPIEHFAAATVHWLLYASLVLVPMTGWIHHAATTGFAPIWWPFGQSLPFVPKDPSIAHTFASLHMIFERVLVLAFLLHVAGALKHHFVDRDATLRRMLPGRAQTANTAQHKGVILPFVTAIGVYVAALGVGMALGLFAHDHSTSAPIAQLDQVETGWQVQTGTLGISVTQFGNEVTGSFADWTAAINFEPQDPFTPAGDVEVTVAIPSLSLGSVTGQALGPDFFNAENFPTATFTADITSQDDGIYVADGVLTLKDVETPISFPFTLTVDGDVADMTGRTTLDRRTFGIGDNISDASNLAFEVQVNIELTATRTP